MLGMTLLSSNDAIMKLSSETLGIGQMLFIRGLIAVAGLILIAIIAVGKAVQLLQMYSRYPERTGLVVIVFLAIIASMFVVSLTHQIFHAREMWVVLAVQEAIFLKAGEVN